MLSALGERGRADYVKPGGYRRRSAFDDCNGGGHGDTAGREGRIGGSRPLSVGSRDEDNK